MHLIDKALRAARTSLFGLVIALPSTLEAQSAAFTLEGAEVVPGEEFSLLLSVSLDRPIRGFQLGVEFPQSAFSFLGVSLDGTALEKKQLESYDMGSGPGFVTLKAVLPDRPASGDVIPAGAAVRLAHLRFRISQGLDPGSTYSLALKGGIGFPPFPALVYVDTRTLSPASLGSAEVKVSEQNVLRTRDLLGLKVDQVRTLEFSAFNIQPLQGFSLVLRFDPSVFRLFQADVEGTITEAVGAEYVAPIIDNVNGVFVLGVLLDSIPPFDHQLIPASGMELTIARVKLQVLRVPPTIEGTELELKDGLGAPPIRNVFVIDNLSYEPVKRNGLLGFVTEGTFIRGDVNEDGVVDISDPVATGMWIFLKTLQVECWKEGDSDDNGVVDVRDMVYTVRYLFLSGDPIAAPYPERGQDLTPDDLPCPASGDVSPGPIGTL